MNKYRPVCALGKGSFGRVWLVREEGTGEMLVAKEIKIASQTELNEAMTEAEIMATITCKHIVRYKEVIRQGNCVTIIMEHCDDGDVESKVQRRRPVQHFFDEEQILSWLVQLVAALHYLHSRGMVHRDIKTTNLFLTSDGDVKLGDLGFAKVLDRTSERLSARTAKTPIGTPLYMAPELDSGRPYTHKVDMWALGCALFEMCSLRPAFVASSRHQLVRMIMRLKGGEHKLPAQYSKELGDIVQSLLTVDPHGRPSCAELYQNPFLKPYFEKRNIELDTFVLPPRVLTMPESIPSIVSPSRDTLNPGSITLPMPPSLLPIPSILPISKPMELTVPKLRVPTGGVKHSRPRGLGETKAVSSPDLIPSIIVEVEAPPPRTPERALDPGPARPHGVRLNPIAEAPSLPDLTSEALDFRTERRNSLSPTDAPAGRIVRRHTLAGLQPIAPISEEAGTFARVRPRQIAPRIIRRDNSAMTSAWG